MAIALFLKVDGATGESRNAAYKGWTDLDSFNWGASQPSSMHVGGGGGAGKVSYQDLTCVCSVDKAFPSLMIKCASGEHISKVEIAGAKAGGDQIEYLKITMEDVLVTHADVNGAEGAEAKVSYGFQPSKLKIEYSEQTEKGTKGATSTFGWNIKENKKM
jgi:type VI secretion system secreted protein Hcp